MKLRLKNYQQKSVPAFPGPGTCPDAVDVIDAHPDDIFHVERKLGLALLATGVVEEVLEPVKPADTLIKWTIVGDITPGRLLALKVECPTCHQGATISASGVPFRHCGKKVSFPPDDMAAEFKRRLASRKPAPKEQLVPPGPSPAELANLISSF